VAVVEQVMSESVEAHVKLVCEQLNEKNRRWVAGLRSEVVGDGDTKWVAEITGVDPNTIRQGRLDLQTGLAVALSTLWSQLRRLGLRFKKP
jgi:transposase